MTTTEWGWAVAGGGAIPMRNESEAVRFVDLHKGSRIFTREVGPWVEVDPPEAARWSDNARRAAALRREAHELDYSDDVTEGQRRLAEELRARADRLDGSGP